MHIRSLANVPHDRHGVLQRILLKQHIWTHNKISVCGSHLFWVSLHLHVTNKNQTPQRCQTTLVAVLKLVFSSANFAPRLCISLFRILQELCFLQNKERKKFVANYSIFAEKKITSWNPIQIIKSANRVWPTSSYKTTICFVKPFAFVSFTSTKRHGHKKSKLWTDVGFPVPSRFGNWLSLLTR